MYFIQLLGIYSYFLQSFHLYFVLFLSPLDPSWESHPEYQFSTYMKSVFPLSLLHTARFSMAAMNAHEQKIAICLKLKKQNRNWFCWFLSMLLHSGKCSQYKFILILNPLTLSIIHFFLYVAAGLRISSI